MQLAQHLCWLARRRPGGTPRRLLAGGGSVLLLPLDHLLALLFVLHHALQTRLHLSCQMPHMPHIALMRTQGLGGAQGVLYSSAAITHRPQRDHPLVLQIPQRQRPTFAIHRYRRQTRPHLRTVYIHHSEVRFAACAAVLFIQRQHTPLLRHLLLQPRLRTLSCVVHQCRDGSQAYLLTQQYRQASLYPSIAGVSFHQQR